jgi:hypothetical protein
MMTSLWGNDRSALVAELPKRAVTGYCEFIYILYDFIKSA